MFLRFLCLLVVIKSELLVPKYLARGYIFENSFLQSDIAANFNILSVGTISLKFYKYSIYGRLDSITETKLLSFYEKNNTIQCKFLTLDHFQNSFINEDDTSFETVKVYKAVYTITTNEKKPRTFVFYDWMTLSKARHFHYEFHRIYESDKKCWTKLLEDNKVKYFRLLGNYSHEHIRKKFDEFCEYLPNITKKECSLKLRLTKSVLEFCVLAASEYSLESNTSQEDIERYEFWKKIRDDAKVLETKLDRKLLTYPRDVNDNKVRNRRVRKNIDYDLLGFLWKRNRVKYQCLEGMALFANIIGMMNEETNADEDCWPMLFPRYLPQRDLLLKRCAYINRANGEDKESEYATVYFYFSKRYDFRKDVSEILKTCQGAYDYNTYCIFDETMLDYKYLRVIIDNGELNGGRLTNVAMSLFELFLNSLKN